MTIRSLQFLIVLVACALPFAGAAGDIDQEPLTLTRVMELAASAAPEVQMAATHVAEWEARLAGAKVRTLEDPELELVAGPRNGDNTSFDAEVGLEIPIELWGRRGKRVAAAEADLRRERHEAEDARREAVGSALRAYFGVLHAEERLRVASERKALADELLRIAEERHRAGDVPRFEVNLARTETARAESDIAAEQGRVAVAQAAMAQSLGLPSGAGLRVEGEMSDRRLFDPLLSAPSSPERPDLLAAMAQVEGSRANIALAEAERRPDVALRLSYQKEGDENVAMAGVAVGLPFLNPRLSFVEETRAKKQRAQIAAEAKKTAVANEIDGARRAYEAAVRSVGRMEVEALPLQRENESLAAESYRAGKMDLATLLQVRREALETRREYLDRLLEAVEAGVGLASAVGLFTLKN